MYSKMDKIQEEIELRLRISTNLDDSDNSNHNEQTEKDFEGRNIPIENVDDDQLSDENLENDDLSLFSFSLLFEEMALWTLWHKPQWGLMAKNLILGVIPSCFDLYSDVQVFFEYLLGTMYTKTVTNVNHEYVNNNSTNCTLESRTSFDLWDQGVWNEEHITYNYSCFETDPVFAWFTFAFIVGVPGLLMLANINEILGNSGKKILACVICCFSPIIIICYPFVLLLCKVATVFQNGKQFKKFSNCLSKVEGIGEAGPQLCVQLFIICSRFDRNPTPMQWFSLVTSAISFNVPMIEAFNRTKPPAKGAKEEIMRIAKFLPLFLCTTLFRVLSIAVVCITLRYNAIIFYVAIQLLFICMVICIPATKFYVIGALWNALTIHNFISSKICPYHFMRKNRRFHMLFWYVLNTITLLSLLILSNSFDVEIDVFGVKHSWSNIPIVANIFYMNAIIAFTLVCGVISLVLFYFQVENPQTPENTEKGSWNSIFKFAMFRKSLPLPWQ